MSWLYARRHQYDGLRPLIEIAHWAVTFHVPPEDRDDAEQELVVYLMQTVKKYGNKGKNYLWAVARHRIYSYLRTQYKERRLFYIQDSTIGEIVGGICLSLNDGGADARLDAEATLATLPERLIQIGHKLLNEEKLSEADQHYWINQKAKLRPRLGCRRYANRLSDWEKRRILHLHREGMSMCKIARTMGRTNKAVMRVLADHQPLSRRSWLAKLRMGTKEREEPIRLAYFVDGKTISQIAREFHCGRHAVRRAIRSAGTD